MQAVIVADVSLHLHRATATGLLADGLADLLTQPLSDPFAQEVVAVPAKGVERWLAQRLSHRLGAGADRQDGVCAGIRFLNPHSLVALVLGVDHDDPWHPDRLAWSVLRAIDDSLDEPWAATLAAHLGHDGPADDLRRGRRYAVARRLAALFASYALQRPTLLTQWRLGGSAAPTDAPTDAPDGLGGSLEADLAWQPHLWRRILEAVDAPPPDVRHAQVIEALRSGAGRASTGAGDRVAAGDGPGALELPGRLSLFGHTRIARSEAELLAALAQHRDVHLWLPQASPAAWAAIAAEVADGPVPRAQDRSVEMIRHPLLAGLGRDARELQRTLAAYPAQDDLLDPPLLDAPPLDAPPLDPALLDPPLSDPPRSDELPVFDPESRAGSPPTLLQWLQADLRADHEPDDAVRTRRVIPASDRSVQIHACHGAARQIDVLRDVVTGLLADDPSLEPRDILVMCPDIEAFASLVHAGFGLGSLLAPERGDEGGESTDPAIRSGAVGPSADAGASPDLPSAGHPAHRLRVRLADRAPRQTNPLLELAARLIVLAGGRLTGGEVLDLARAAAVRRRFRFDDDDLDRLDDWVDAVAVRWGLDEQHRGDYQLSHFRQNTWRAGVDRILVGAALDGRDHDHLGTTLALDDLDSADIDLAGRLAEFIDRLGSTLAALRACEHAADWVATLREGVLGLADVGRDEAWQLTQFAAELARVDAAASRGGGATRLRLADLHALLGEHLSGRASRANFRTGTLTVCTMVPMRSVPHRVVCLVGLDDGVFPRTSTPDGDDALARTPVTGERDARSEDRQLLLDAVMSAQETLVITYAGADEHTGASRPPAVPLGELLDTLRVTASGPGIARLETRHPLQSYDPRNLGARSEPASPDPVESADPGESDAALPQSSGEPDLPLRADDEPFTFDPGALAGAQAYLLPRAPLAPFEGLLLPPRPEDDVDLAELIRFLQHPARTFLRTRLGILLPQVPEQRGDGIPIELDGLSTWHIGDRMLRAILAGRDLEDVRQAELWRGELPPGMLGQRVLEAVTDQVKAITRTGWRVLGQGGPGHPADLHPIDVDIDLPDIDLTDVHRTDSERTGSERPNLTESTDGTGPRRSGGSTGVDGGFDASREEIASREESMATSPRRLWGTVPGVVGRGGYAPAHDPDAAALQTVEITYSTVRPSHRLRSWILALALSATQPNGSPGASSHVIGQARRGRRKVVVHYAHGPIPPAQARRHLAELVDLRDRGLREPIPLPVATAAAWAQACFDADPQADPFLAASREWVASDNPLAPPGEQDDPSHLRIHGAAVPLADILGDPRPDETWFPGVTSRLGQLALRVWSPLLTGGVELREDG